MLPQHRSADGQIIRLIYDTKHDQRDRYAERDNVFDERISNPNLAAATPSLRQRTEDPRDCEIRAAPPSPGPQLRTTPMNRLTDLEDDPAFQQAVLAVRGAASTLSGRAVTVEEARFLVGIALTTFAHAGGLNEPSRSRLARFSETVGQGAVVETLTKH
jgi:hypothetical protein